MPITTGFFYHPRNQSSWGCGLFVLAMMAGGVVLAIYSAMVAIIVIAVCVLILIGIGSAIAIQGARNGSVQSRDASDPDRSGR